MYEGGEGEDEDDGNYESMVENKNDGGVGGGNSRAQKINQVNYSGSVQTHSKKGRVSPSFANI